MKALDLLLMIITANVLFMILSGIGCYMAPGTVNINLGQLSLDTLFGTGAGIVLALAVVGILGRQLNPIAWAFVGGFIFIWSVNVGVLAGFVGIGEYFTWYTKLFIDIVGGILATIGALELHSGVRL